MFHESGQTHFLTFSCYQRRPFLTAIESRLIFESALERVRLRFFLRVYGYVVMPEHVHLLISEPDGAPFKPAVGLSGGESVEKSGQKRDLSHLGFGATALRLG